jgi:hypothetical protein
MELLMPIVEITNIGKGAVMYKKVIIVIKKYLRMLNTLRIDSLDYSIASR